MASCISLANQDFASLLIFFPSVISSQQHLPITTHLQNVRKNRENHSAPATKVILPRLFQSRTNISSPRITEGQYYEAQQQTRVVAARYIKSKTWDAAIDILFSVSQSLLKAGQGGSGGDLGIFLIDVYRQAELKPDAGNKGKLLVLLRLFDAEEPTRKTFIGEMIGYVLFCRCRERNWAEMELDGLPSAVIIQRGSPSCTMLLDLCTQKSTTHMKLNDTLHLVRKTPQRSLRSWNTSGILKTTRTLLRYTLRERFSHIYLWAI
jgi:hypothetical protein